MATASVTSSDQAIKAVTPTPERLAIARKAVVSSTIGASLERFDIIEYASSAAVISRIFFPDTDEYGLIYTFGIFAITYLKGKATHRPVPQPPPRANRQRA